MYTVVYNVDILYLKSLSAGIGTKKAGGSQTRRKNRRNQHSPRQWFESEPIQMLCLMARRRCEKVAPNGRNSPLNAGSASCSIYFTSILITIFISIHRIRIPLLLCYKTNYEKMTMENGFTKRYSCDTIGRVYSTSSPWIPTRTYL